MKKTTHDEFVKKSNKIHENKYDYSLCSFVGVKTKVKILCSKHGLFEQRSQHHLAGHGCRKCSRELIAESSRLTLNDFLKKSKNIHGNTGTNVLKTPNTLKIVLGVLFLEWFQVIIIG